MPYATEVPVVEIDHPSTPSPLNSARHQGRRRGGVIPGMAVIAAAIEDAEGFRLTRWASRRPSCSTCASAMPPGRSRRCAVPPGRAHEGHRIGEIAAPRDEVWKALNDPAVLVRTIPGVSRLEEIDTDVYRMTIYAGVASIKGTYQGEVRLAEQQQPDSFVLRATGTARREPSTPTWRSGSRRRMRRLASTTTRTRWSAA